MSETNKTFQLSALITVSIYTEVKAESLEQAISIAKERQVEMNHPFQHRQSEDCWVCDGFDGEPLQITEDN